jgi:SAM-dependent methyltransferase
MSSLLTNGFASLSDLSDSDLQAAMKELTVFQDSFLGTGPHDPGYPWPPDALHWWSRVWEYPYVWANLQSLTSNDSNSDLATILDFGSGVTAFPFFVAKKLSKDVICMDTNGSFAGSIARTSKALGVGGHISFLQNTEGPLPMKDASVGCVYSVSVLEHIPEANRLLGEFHRILKPGGILVLTMDVSLRLQDTGINAVEYRKIHESLLRFFDPVYARRPVHPTDVLTSENSPLPIRKSAPFRAQIRTGSRLFLKNRLPGRPKIQPWWKSLLCCDGFVGRRRAHL